MFDFLRLKTTDLQILEILIENRTANMDDVITAINRKFPRMSRYEIDSHLWSLSHDNYIQANDGDSEITDFILFPNALARMRENYELRKHDRIWDIIKFTAGFISGLITAYLKMNM